MTETSTGIETGQEMPAFELPDEQSQPFNLIQQLEEGPIVLVFYRGDWWPYCNGQLVSYARKYEEFEKRGTRVTGMSVDPPSHSKVMVEKLTLPFQLLSDPTGDLAKLCGLWNDKESVAVPAIMVIDRGGIIRYLYSGNDFADRPGDEEMLEALDKTPEAITEKYANETVQIRVSSEEAESSTVRPERPAITLEQLVPYYRGAFFTTVALKKRFGELEDKVAFKEVDEYQLMVKEYSKAINETREMKRGS